MSSIECAFEAFKAICDFMRAANVKYEVPSEDNVAFAIIKGEQFPVTLMFSTNAASERAETYSELPFSVKDEYELPFAKAVNLLNGILPLGKFCYYPDEGSCSFESSEYLSGLSGFTEDYGRMIVAGAYTLVQKFGPMLFEVANGRMTVEQIAEVAKREKGEKGYGKETI